MFDHEPSPHEVENWECILSTNKSFEAEMLKNYLMDHEIPCHILSKKDSSYVVDFSSLSMVFVYVPVDFAEQAKALMADLDSQVEDVEEEDEDGQDDVD